jgi:hypothetical protein
MGEFVGSTLVAEHREVEPGDPFHIALRDKGTFATMRDMAVGLEGRRSGEGRRIMSDFVQQCRAEWTRLGVPGAPVEEMAAELASDLGEAESEGLSAEEVLGRDASDPRAFAASWAAERGIVPEPPSRGHTRRRPRFLVAFTAVTGIALAVAVLLLATGEPTVALRAFGATPPHLVPPAGPSLPAGLGHEVQASAAAPVEWILLFLAIAGLGFAGWLWSRWGRSEPPVGPVW